MGTPLAARLVRILALSAAWTSSTDPGSACEEDWLRFGSSCYKKMETPNGWLGARHDCVWEGGDLVSVASSNEEAFVKEKMGDVPFWIGLSNLNCDEAWCQYDKEQKKLTWSYVRVTATYSNWTKGLNGNSDVESCAYVNLGVHHDNQLGKWRHGSCGSSLPYMCERSLDDCLEGRQCSFKDFGYNRVETSSCDPGDFLFDDSCYHFGREKMNRQPAEDFCKERKSHLASVHSQDVLKFLGAHIRSNRYGWVGLARKNGNYEYTDGTSIDDTPRLHTFTYNCIAVFYAPYLCNANCDSNHSAICKKAKVRKALTAHPSSVFRPGWSEKCGRWMENPANDFCYLISQYQDVTWQEARDKCVDHGGDLLSLADDTEQKFIQDLRDIPLTLWLGANAEITEGSKWTDGSPFIYKNLKADNASDATGGRCLSLLTADGDWKFDQCQKNSSYICKRRGRGNVTLGRFALTSEVLSMKYVCVLLACQLSSHGANAIGKTNYDCRWSEFLVSHDIGGKTLIIL